MDRGKRLSRSNIIGETGEILFRRWALDHHLTANKCATDIGIDFFCQAVAPVAGSGSLEAKGPVLAAQVKTTENDNSRLSIDRIDATDLLRQTHATCLFGISLVDESVRFQFVDRTFIDRLVAFLDGNTQELSISFKKMASDARLFLRLLNKYTNPFEQMQLRVHLIQRRLKVGIPEAEFSVESTGEETLARVYVPWISSAFTAAPESKEKIRLSFIREGIVDLGLEGVHIHPAIEEALRSADGTRAIITGLGSVLTTVKVCWQGASATQPFDYRKFGTEKNFVHRSGLRITVDRATVQASNGEYRHVTQSELFRPSQPTSLTGSSIGFFRLFRPGASIKLQDGWEAPLETFGDGLTRIGKALEGLPNLCTALKQSLRHICLGDLQDEEFSRSYTFLQNLLVREVPIGAMTNGFLVGPAAELPLDQIPTTHVIVRVPIAMNWMKAGFVIWVDCNGDAFLHNGQICGFRLKDHTAWRIRKTSRLKKSVYPEMWFAKNWPEIPIRENLSGTRTWMCDGTALHPFGAQILRQPGMSNTEA